MKRVMIGLVVFLIVAVSFASEQRLAVEIRTAADVVVEDIEIGARCMNGGLQFFEIVEEGENSSIQPSAVVPDACMGGKKVVLKEGEGTEKTQVLCDASRKVRLIIDIENMRFLADKGT